MKSVRVIILFLLGGCLLTNCSVKERDSTDLTITATPRYVVVTIDPTATPTITSTEIPTIVSTTIQTQSSTELRVKFTELVQNNGSCKFPCIWGIIPGSTNKEQFVSIIGQFDGVSNDIIYIDRFTYDAGGLFFVALYDQGVEYRYNLDYYFGNETVSQFIFDISKKNKDTYKEMFGDQNFNKANQYYMLPSILANYGRPSQVLIFTFANELDTQMKWFPFIIILYYQEEGFLIQYLTPSIISGNMVSGCPSQSHIRISTWNPNEIDSLEKAVARFSGDGIVENRIQRFKPIEDVSMTIDEFYETFIEPGNLSCIETRKDIW